MSTPELWQRTIAGQKIGAWHVTVKGKRINLRTKDFDVAKKRRRLALGGQRTFAEDESMRAPRPARAKVSGQVDEGAADRLIAALDADPSGSTGPVAVPERSPTGGGAPVDPPGPSGPEPERVEAEPIPNAPRADGWTDDVRAAAAAGAAPEAPPHEPPPPSPDELAKLGVTIQVWGATVYAQQTVYSGFVAPELPPEGRAPLEAEWRKIIEYSGVSGMLPPWVTGLVIPGVTLALATFAMAKGFAVVAEEQRKAAGAPPIKPKVVAPPPAAPASAAS